jgi:hypothetical protein
VADPIHRRSLPIPGLTLTIPFVFALVLTAAADCARGQELGVLGGAEHSNETGHHSRAWAVDYQENFGRHLGLGVAYVNDGHASNDHRDGAAVQLRARATALDPRLTLVAGIGPIYLFNTTRAAHGSDTVDHGWGMVYSLAATWELGRSWYVQARVQHIDARSGFDTTGVLFGAGRRFGPSADGSGAGSLVPTDSEPRHEIGIMAGRTVANTFHSETAGAQAIEYRGRLIAPFEWTVTALNESDTGPVRRNGVAAQFWAAHSLTGRFRVAAGAGPYAITGLHHGPAQTDTADDRFAGIASATAAYDVANAWRLRFVWNRVFAQHSRDTDVFLLGVGYRY